MERQRSGSYEGSPIEAPLANGGRLDADGSTVVTSGRPVGGYYPGTVTGENVMTARNRVQWGPIMAGLLTTIATMIVLTVLGLAIGASAFEPRADGEDIATGAAIWGGISAIIAFLVGGWVAAKTAAVGGGFSGLMNGFMVGATALALILWLTSTGLGNLLGTLGTNIGDIANVVQDQAQQEGVTTQDAEAQAADVQAQAEDAAQGAESTLRNSFDEVRDGAWGTLIGLLLALGAAAVGGLLGQNKRRDLIEGTG